MLFATVSFGDVPIWVVIVVGGIAIFGVVHIVATIARFIEAKHEDFINASDEFGAMGFDYAKRMLRALGAGNKTKAFSIYAEWKELRANPPAYHGYLVGVALHFVKWLFGQVGDNKELADKLRTELNKIVPPAPAAGAPPATVDR